jgi:hypothetical protein
VWGRYREALTRWAAEGQKRKRKKTKRGYGPLDGPHGREKEGGRRVEENRDAYKTEGE